MWSWPRSKWSSCRSRTGSRTASPPTPPGRTHILPSRTRRSPCSTSSSGSPGGRCQHGSSDSIPEPARSGAATASGVRARAQPAVPIGAGAGGREEALRQLEESYLDMVKTLAFVVEAKDPTTRAHLDRTHDYATALAQVVDDDLASDHCLRYGFLLHDVGKVGVPEAILNKPGPLDED